MAKRDKFLTRDTQRVRRIIEKHPFALVVPLRAAAQPVHLPLVLRSTQPELVLAGHLAAQNPAVDQLEGDVVVTFLGSHAYVSPTWYSANNRVPTWNYVAAYCWGTLRFQEDGEARDRDMQQMVRTFEGSGPDAWAIEQLPDQAYQRRLRSIRSFEVSVERAEAIDKLSQDKQQSERDEVIAGLRAAGKHELVEEMLAVGSKSD